MEDMYKMSHDEELVSKTPTRFHSTKSNGKCPAQQAEQKVDYLKELAKNEGSLPQWIKTIV